jgi:hypothetical protein
VVIGLVVLRVLHHDRLLSAQLPREAANGEEGLDKHRLLLVVASVFLGLKAQREVCEARLPGGVDAQGRWQLEDAAAAHVFDGLGGNGHLVSFHFCVHPKVLL